MKYNSTQSGFSLVETLVAITIVLIVIVGPMTIMSTASKSTNFTNEHVVAFFLAQEGVELAQKARDDIVLQRFAGGNPSPHATFWDKFYDDTAGPYSDCFQSLPYGCGLEIENTGGAIETPMDCSPGNTGNCNLYFESSPGNIRARYTHAVSGNTAPTPYNRVVSFEQINAYDVRVRSRVEWFSGLSRNAQQVEVETVLFNVYAP